MKRRISDLIDAVPPAQLTLHQDTPLSSQRIKELTMSKIQKKRGKRMGFRVFMVAAILTALGVTAVAADQLWGVSGIFLGTFSEKLSAEDVETIDQLGASFSLDNPTPEDVALLEEQNDTFTAGITSNGATITPISILGDDDYFHLHLRVDAPEGTVLPDDSYYQLSGYEQGTHLEFHAPRNIYSDISCEMTVETLPDTDPTDNVKEFVIKWYTIDDMVDLTFNDGISKVLVIHGLWEQTGTGEYREIFTGEFVFDIGRYKLLQMAKPEVDGLTGENERCAITLKSMNVTPLSITYVFQVDEQFTLDSPGGNFTIVKKDGTSMETMRGLANYDAATDLWECEGRFGDYVALEDMDYILFGSNKIQVEPIPIEMTPIPVNGN